MSRRKRGWCEDQKDDPDTDRSLFSRIVEGVIVFVVCCFLVKLGVAYLISVRVPLLIIAVIVGSIVIIYRVCKRRDHDDY